MLTKNSRKSNQTADSVWYDWIGSSLEVIEMTLRLRFLMFSIKGNRVHAEFHFCTLWYLLPHKILHNFIEIYWPKDSWWLRRTVPLIICSLKFSNMEHICDVLFLEHLGFIEVYDKSYLHYLCRKWDFVLLQTFSQCQDRNYMQQQPFSCNFFIFFALFLRISLWYFSFYFSLN